jgi:hypothetical protein
MLEGWVASSKRFSGSVDSDPAASSPHLSSSDSCDAEEKRQFWLSGFPARRKERTRMPGSNSRVLMSVHLRAEELTWS